MVDTEGYEGLKEVKVVDSTCRSGLAGRFKIAEDERKDEG
jgi:hypothetical protein